MKIINFLWGFSTGGIGKCFLIYDKLGLADENLAVKSVCIVTQNSNYDMTPLETQSIDTIVIRNNSDFSWMKQMKKVVDTEKPDYLFCHGHNGPIMLSLFKLRYLNRTPMICTCHGVNLPAEKRINTYITKVWMGLYRSDWVKKIICVERFTPPQLSKYGIKQNKVVTVYNGIEPQCGVQKLDLTKYHTEGPIIITASRLTRIKGVNYLLDALKILKDRDIKFHFFCIGDGEEEAMLKKQAEEFNLTDKITFTGYQGNVPEWLESCDIFVLPSLEEFHSIAILEAMRAKKTIVATNIGGNPETLRDKQDALMVPSMDSNSLAEALERVLTDKNLRNKLSASAHQRFMERFTIDIMMRNLAREIMNT